MKKDNDTSKTSTKKNQEDLTRTDPSTKKGYNEKNPSQPQGAFSPDSKEQHDSVEGDADNSTDNDEINKSKSGK